MTRDPLCRAANHGIGFEDCICHALRTARLQGPIRQQPQGHVAGCFCPTCWTGERR